MFKWLKGLKYRTGMFVYEDGIVTNKKRNKKLKGIVVRFNFKPYIVKTYNGVYNWSEIPNTLGLYQIPYVDQLKKIFKLRNFLNNKLWVFKEFLLLKDSWYYCKDSNFNILWHSTTGELDKVVPPVCPHRLIGIYPLEV